MVPVVLSCVFSGSSTLVQWFQWFFQGFSVVPGASLLKTMSFQWFLAAAACLPAGWPHGVRACTHASVRVSVCVSVAVCVRVSRCARAGDSLPLGFCMHLRGCALGYAGTHGACEHACVQEERGWQARLQACMPARTQACLHTSKHAHMHACAEVGVDATERPEHVPQMSRRRPQDVSSSF